MLSMKDISQLIGHTFGVAYLNIHIIVRVTIYPEINPAILDVVFQFHCESSIGLAVGKYGSSEMKPGTSTCTPFFINPQP